MIVGESNPGIAPRAFMEIFRVLDENDKKFSYNVTLYMCELYDDQLLDLFSVNHNKKLDIKKDKKGLIYACFLT